MVRVFLVEDSSPICERLEAMLASIAGATTIGRARSADEAVRTILSERPDAVVLDLRLAQGTGFDVLRAVHEQAPEIDLYVLSNHAGEPYRRRAEQLGARGFFDKTTEFGRVLETLAARAERARN
jgi:DNA-binding NarL/FixJ family response regulator